MVEWPLPNAGTSPVDTQTLVALPLVLAMEPVAGEAAARQTLTRDEAAELVELIAADLHAVVPQVDAARLALAGALFDTVELLRPGFPVWHTLEDLARRVPRAHLNHVVAFGTHEGQMPAPALEPSPLYAEGPMRLLPLLLLAPAELAETLSAEIEVQLVGRGATGNATADWLMRTLGLRLEHARYFSRGDLMAMVSVQYEHANLAPMWQLLEAALLTPAREEATMSLRGLALRYAHGEVLAQPPAAWLAAQDVPADPRARAHDFAGILFELRQYMALLGAHGVALRLDAAEAVHDDAGWLLEPQLAPDPQAATPELYAHEAPGLGVVAVSVAQRGGDPAPRLLAHGYPLTPRALGALLETLATRYGCAAELQAPGHVVLDGQGRLGVPPAPLH